MMVGGHPVGVGEDSRFFIHKSGVRPACTPYELVKAALALSDAKRERRLAGGRMPPVARRMV